MSACPLAPTFTRRVDARDRCTGYSAKREFRGVESCMWRMLHDTPCMLDASQIEEKIKQARGAK